MGHESRPVSFSTKRDESEALSKIKQRLIGRMETKDLSLRGGSVGGRRGTRKLSLFESMGISPTLSPTTPFKKAKEIPRFSIINSEDFASKSSRLSGDILPKTLSALKPQERIPGASSFTERSLNTLGRASIKSYHENRESSLFQSPLIKRISPRLEPSLDLASLLVSSYSEYLEKKRLKKLADLQKESRKAFHKSKAMKEMIHVFLTILEKVIIIPLC